MTRRKLAAALVAFGTFGTGAAFAQPTLQPQGGGATEMDHSRMGGGQGRNSGPAPTLQPQGGGTGNAEMQHGQMGGRAGAGGGTPSMNPTGGGTGNAEMTHPGNAGTGHGHQQNPPATQRRN